MKILVTGADGQVGQAFRQLASGDSGMNFLFAGREDLDITDPEAVRRYFDSHQPTHCINCAAYTAVDRAESEPERSAAINAGGAGNLARACTATGARLIHLSTDYVFDGLGKRPYVETDPTGPTGVYGATKLAGEKRCVEENGASIIIRTAWVFSPFGTNFVKTMLRLMAERDRIAVVNDQRGCPTSAGDIADAIAGIIGSGTWVPGIYHFGNRGETTWFGLATAIQRMCGFDCAVEPVVTEDYPTAAKRPAYSVLDTGKIEAVYGIRPRNWEDALADCLTQLAK
jgi:dTDP-4-dehydrorhamnose reductase